MVKNKSHKDAPIMLEDHLAHMHDLVDDALEQEYEAGWYHPANHALNYNAFRNSSKRGMLSVYPQARLSLLKHRKREEPRNVPEIPTAADAEDHTGNGEPEDDVSGDPSSVHEGDDRSFDSGGSGDRDDPKSQFPDFVVVDKFPSKRNYAVFVVEVKPPPTELDTTQQEQSKVTQIMDNALSQNIQQAQFAFAEFPTQTVVHIVCMVATYFRVLTFQRSKLPKVGEYWPSTPRFRIGKVNSIFETENGEYTDYSKPFKTWWTKAMEEQEKQEARELEVERTRQLVKDVVKEAAAVAAAKNAAENAGADPIVAGNGRENAAPL